eukprot:11056879-Lingulodinium_polyedra.AAC.1
MQNNVLYNTTQSTARCDVHYNATYDTLQRATQCNECNGLCNAQCNNVQRAIPCRAQRIGTRAAMLRRVL